MDQAIGKQNELDESTVTKKYSRFLQNNGENGDGTSSEGGTTSGEPAPEANPAPTTAADEEEGTTPSERVKDIRTTMIVLIGVIGVLTSIGICCFIFSLNECNNKEPDSDLEEYGEEDYGEEEAEDEEGGLEAAN